MCRTAIVSEFRLIGGRGAQIMHAHPPFHCYGKFLKYSYDIPLPLLIRTKDEQFYGLQGQFEPVICKLTKL